VPYRSSSGALSCPFLAAAFSFLDFKFQLHSFELPQLRQSPADYFPQNIRSQFTKPKNFSLPAKLYKFGSLLSRTKFNINREAGYSIAQSAVRIVGYTLKVVVDHSNLRLVASRHTSIAPASRTSLNNIFNPNTIIPYLLKGSAFSLHTVAPTKRRLRRLRPFPYSSQFFLTKSTVQQ
jgi:hypothetical protein